MLEGDQDRVDGVSEPQEGIDAGTPDPLQHCSWSSTGLLEGKLEDEAKVLLEEVGAEKRLVDALDPDQLALRPS